VYAFAWGADNDSVTWASGKTLNIKSYQNNTRKAVSWQAHEGIILAVDWNRMSDLVISGGEDCVFKVWDPFGRQLFQSSPLAHMVTSIAWSPNGTPTDGAGSRALTRCVVQANASLSGPSIPCACAIARAGRIAANARTLVP
jgi:WD40 repeat protein